MVVEDISAGRSNVYGLWTVAGCTRWRAVDVHLDTVSVKHCVGDPFSGTIDEENKLHGRGACDTKATMALCLSILDEVRRGALLLTANLLLAGTAGEEVTKIGASRFRAWLGERKLVIDELVVAEPTLCQPIIGHKGVCAMQFDFEGLAVHSSQPQLGT